MKFDIEKARIEILFIILASIFGTLLVFINPPFHANDEDRHFYKAWYLSQGNFAGFKRDSVRGGYLPINIIKSIEYSQYFQFSDTNKLDFAKMWSNSNKPLQPDSIIFKPSPTTQHFGISYIPHAIGLSIGRIIGASPLWIGWLARLSGLAFYILCIFLIIKYIPLFKYLFFIVALTPSILYQATSVTYDTMIILCCFAITAFTLFKMYQGTIFGFRDYLLMGLITVVLTLVKSGYDLVPFIVLLIPVKQFKNKLHYLLTILFIIIAIKAPDVIWKTYLNSINYDNALRLQSDFVTSFSNQLKFISEDISQFIYNMFLNIIKFKFDWLKGIIARFGYSYTPVDTLYYYIHAFALISVAFLDSDPVFKISKFTKLMFFTIAFLNILMIILGFYLYLTPVGSKLIFGIQGRYFIPLLPILLILLYNNIKKFQLWDEHKNKIVFFYSGLSLLYIVLYLKSYFYY